MTIPLAVVIAWTLAGALLLGAYFRKCYRVGYLESIVADRERQIEQWRARDEARERAGHYGAGLASVPSFGFATRSDLFDAPLPGAYSHMPPGWDGWNNYHGATGPAGEWAQRDRDRREGRR